MKKWNISQHGFSIVELLITVVIVSILASLTVNAYSGVQQRSRDTRRVSDMNAIVKALEMYKIQTGSYPAPSTTNTLNGWEISSINPQQFLLPLKTAGIASKVPVDPINDNTLYLKGFLYRYYRYASGSNGCDPARGEYYILVVGDAETSTSRLDSSPGFQCSGRDWSNEGGWVTGAYLK